MLFGEPSRTQGDLNFSLLGIPVRIHPMFWLVALLLGIRSENARELLVWVAALTVSILWHEMGHALVQRAYGARPWVTLYSLGGLASYHPGDFSRGEQSPALRQILISLAGPGAGFVLAAIVAGLVWITGHEIVVELGAPYGVMIIPRELVGSVPLTRLIFDLLFISVAWGLVNLMPVYPLDGGHVAREVLVAANPREGIRQSLWLSIITAAGLAVFGLLEWKSWFMALLFGYLAYTSYTTLQRYEGRVGPW